MTEQMGKVMIVAGVGVVAVGFVVYLVSKWLPGGLPGDVVYRGQRVTIWLPIGTCIVISVVLTAILWIWQWLGR